MEGLVLNQKRHHWKWSTWDKTKQVAFYNILLKYRVSKGINEISAFCFGILRIWWDLNEIQASSMAQLGGQDSSKTKHNWRLTREK